MKSDGEYASWKNWGPYLSDRQWGTVREDYSTDGSAWEHISHDLARSYAYRWGEDGIGGISDQQQLLCLSFAFWNQKDPIIKERLFGLTGNQGNHGEDVKEYYYYLDNNPVHSYQKMLYKYPQQAFPYEEITSKTRQLGKKDPEYELIDTGIFDLGKYFNLTLEYAKVSPYTTLIQLSAENFSTEKAILDILPQAWFRNTWSWSFPELLPQISVISKDCLKIEHPELGVYFLKAENPQEVLICNNESNPKKVPEAAANVAYFKDGINDYVVNKAASCLINSGTGTKAAFRFHSEVSGKAIKTFRLILTKESENISFDDFSKHFEERREENQKFYDSLQTKMADEENKRIHREALAGLLWNKQFYYYDVKEWLDGDVTGPTASPARINRRNHEWQHLVNEDIISMPDKWEYPWYAAWDLAFHAVPLSLVDPDFAKKQMLLITNDFYMHPNGQLPAYEWSFNDVNPPVHAWAAWKIYQNDQRLNHLKKGDLNFLEKIFHRLVINFMWWVNRRDSAGHNLFDGGFLGLDNIAVFDRSAPLPAGGTLSQADATSWMAMYSLNMMRIAIELASHNNNYEEVAGKFFHHFLLISEAMTNMAGKKIGLWDEEDKFYYDALNLPNGEIKPLKVRSIVGLIPLFAVEVLDQELLDLVPKFRLEMNWFFENRPELANLVSRWNEPGRGSSKLLSLLRGHRMKKLLSRMLDPKEFLSEYGIRAMSKFHEANPFKMNIAGQEFNLNYQPGESENQMFGGNSNWRGPIWLPMNYLIIESLQRFHSYYSDDFLIECPTGSGQFMTLKEIAQFLSERLIKLFKNDQNNHRPIYNLHEKIQNNPDFNDQLLFFEYFHGECGKGLGASHQTGWTSLIADLIQNPIK